MCFFNNVKDKLSKKNILKRFETARSPMPMSQFNIKLVDKKEGEIDSELKDKIVKMSRISHGTLFNTVLVLSEYSGFGKTYQIH